MGVELFFNVRLCCLGKRRNFFKQEMDKIFEKYQRRVEAIDGFNP